MGDGEMGRLGDGERIFAQVIEIYNFNVVAT